MPTFETDSPDPSPEKDNSWNEEFRPRRREGKKARSKNDTFSPAAVPEAVKSSISERINEIMRQTRGPDETMFAIREVFNRIGRAFGGVPKLIKKLLGRDDESSLQEELDDVLDDVGSKRGRDQHGGHKRNRRSGRHRTRHPRNRNDNRGRDEGP